MSQKHILAILGSPHANGTTANMLEHSIRAAQQAGYAVTKVNLYEKRIAFCTGCGACLASGVCVLKDNIQEIVSLLHSSDVVILAAPVYWANVPAPVKNLFDRLRGTAMEETAMFPKPRLQGKKYMLLTACSTPAPFSWICWQSRGAIRNMDEFFKTAGLRPMGKITCANTGKRKKIPAHIYRKIERCWR